MYYLAVALGLDLVGSHLQDVFNDCVLYVVTRLQQALSVRTVTAKKRRSIVSVGQSIDAGPFQKTRSALRRGECFQSGCFV